MTFIVTEKIVGYRRIAINADSREKAEALWFKGEGNVLTDDFISYEAIDWEEEEED